MKEKSKEELEKKILDDIEKTGFVSELKVVSTFLNSKWETEHSFTYEDKDENVSREIDVIASRKIYDKDFRCSIEIHLVVEIKKSENPWVIFTTKKNAAGSWVNGLLINGENWMIRKKLSQHQYNVHAIGKSEVRVNCPRQSFDKVGKAFHELHKPASDKSKIYSALISSGKASIFFKEMTNKGDDTPYNPEKNTRISIFLPLVIIDGLLFEVYNSDNGEIKVEQSNYVPVELFYSSPKYRNNEKQTGIVFAPDVITFDYLTTFIKTIEIWQKSMQDFALQKLKREFQ